MFGILNKSEGGDAGCEGPERRRGGEDPEGGKKIVAVVSSVEKFIFFTKSV